MYDPSNLNLFKGFFIQENLSKAIKAIVPIIVKLKTPSEKP